MPQETEEQRLLRLQKEEAEKLKEAPPEEAAPEQLSPEPQAAPAPPPQTAPQTEPQPEPQAAPQPEPEAQPAPAPRPEATAPAADTPAATPQHEPGAQAEPAPAPVPKPETPALETTPDEAPAPESAPAEPAPQPQPDVTPAPESVPQGEPEAAPAPEKAPKQPATGKKQPAAEPAPVEGTQPPVDGAAPAPSGKASQPENAAPVLDSAKEAPAETAGETPGKVAQPAAPAEPALQPPADDKAAQETAQPAAVQAVTAEKGQRVAEPPASAERKRPAGTEVIKEIGDRIIIQINNQIIVESTDRPRISRGARDVYFEDLPHGRTRETVIRDDGTEIVTIRNAYGDIVRRSRITPDGREYVLVYVDDRYYDRLDDRRDPGLDLPPMRLDVAVSEYILDAGRVENPEAYYEFLKRPPVERVERLYSVDEVKRSARIRDKVPRVELDTVTFEFGSATIAESEVPRLQGIADAIERLLKRNPAETFLIEGHTDAVGSDVANLALSDRRAEAVADALTAVFGIAPENLATQGYGERYLKIETQEAERLNRRVAIRRITPLVAPIASAN